VGALCWLRAPCQWQGRSAVKALNEKLAEAMQSAEEAAREAGGASVPVPLRVARMLQIHVRRPLAALGLALAAASLSPLPSAGGFWPRTSPPSSGRHRHQFQAWLRSMPCWARGDAAEYKPLVISAAAARTTTCARDVSLRLLGLYRDLAGAFRAPRREIPRGRWTERSPQALEALAQSQTLRLAALSCGART